MPSASRTTLAGERTSVPLIRPPLVITQAQVDSFLDALPAILDTAVDKAEV